MFTPPEALLQFIQVGGFRLELALPSFKVTTESDGPMYTIAMLSGALDDIYREENSSATKVKHRLLTAFWEALANASDHGNRSDEGKEIVVGCWFGKEGVLLAFRDEGRFFSILANKKLVESRTPLPSTRKGAPGGDGMLDIYKADEVFVSTGENTLYLAFKID